MGFSPLLNDYKSLKSVLWNFAAIRVLPFLNNHKDLGPSYKMDLDFWNCFGRKKLYLMTEEMQYAYLLLPIR